MRDLIVSFIIIGAMPLCFRRPFIGLLMFTLLAYMRLQDLTWGFARGIRWSYFISMIMFAGFLMSRGDKRMFVPDMRSWIMLALVGLVGLSLLFQPGDINWQWDFQRYIEYAKIITIALFTTAVVKHRDHLRMLMLVIALSFGFYGVKGGLQGILSGGSSRIIEGPGGMISDNNDFAMALCMGLPLLFVLGMSEKRDNVRKVLLAMVPLTAITIVMTYSRGAFLSLVCLSSVLIWRSRNRVAGFTIMGLVGMAGALAVPKDYVERLGTIVEHEDDASARGRLNAWRVAGNMIAANPFFGVGFDKFQGNYRFYDFVGKNEMYADTGKKVAHNSYLQIWAECGTPTFLLYLTLIALTFMDIWRIRKIARHRYNASWILSYATGFEATMTAFVVGSMFLNRAHFDLFYHFVAIITAFEAIARQEMSGLGERAVKRAATGEVRALPPTGFGRMARGDGFGDAPAWGGQA